MTTLPASADALAGVPGRRAPWDLQPGETGLAFASFVAYREIEPLQRSYAEVARSTGKSIAMVERWGRRNAWQARALAWDDEKARRKASATFDAIEAAARRQAGLGLLLQSVARQGAEELRTSRRRLKATEVAALTTAGIKAERDALGMPDRVQTDVRAVVAHMNGVAPAPGGSVDDALELALADPLVAEAADLLAQRLEDLARRDRGRVDGALAPALEPGPAPELPEPAGRGGDPEG